MTTKNTFAYYEHRMAIDPVGKAWTAYWLGVRDRIKTGYNETEAKDWTLYTISLMYPEVLWG